MFDAAEPRDQAVPAVRGFIHATTSVRQSDSGSGEIDKSHTNNRITGVSFTIDAMIKVDALFIRAPMIQRSPLHQQPECRLTTTQGMFTDAVETDPFGATDVPDLYVLGDASLGAPQVANAVSDGSITAIMANESLLEEGRTWTSESRLTTSMDK